MKVRVPKELRPPHRFQFVFKPEENSMWGGEFRVVCFRFPKKGEFYWTSIGTVGKIGTPINGPRVILERVK